MKIRKRREEKIVFTSEKNKVTLIEDMGHSLVLKAESPQAMLLFIDGKPQKEIRLESTDTYINLPKQCLRGEIVTVSIRDLSGSQEFLSIRVLAPRVLTPHEVMARESRAPMPTDLTVRANHRYKALRAHLEDPIPGMEQASLWRALEALDYTYDTVKLRPIKFPKIDEPKVSVIIPAHNKVAVTYYGLCALLVAHNKASFEVIVVDDGSTDDTKKLEKIVSGIHVVRNSEPQRFIRACNAGVAVSRGEYVVLLNNDTEATTGWLDELIWAFERFENVGLAGSKLLYPDGKLQDAGGIVWGTGNPWNYGNRENPWEPRFSYARQADYLSGAAMMTTRAIWDEVGGLSSYLEPMYFEDTDFAFKVREAGYTTWFIPSSIVYHFEGATSGTDTSRGFKRYQEVNRPKFKRRWVRDFSAFGKEGQEPNLEKDRGIVGRVLFIDYTTPREDRDAGSYAARREIELVQSLGYKVSFLPQNLAHFGSYTEELQKSGVEVIVAPFYLSVEEFLEKRG
ncbi:MAG: glycosyltransferase family 2 protein, partial [Bdellovibrionales bacterium]|nr:glycosyltransferase family 2 protein [Bdellovibrionales bacterium]